MMKRKGNFKRLYFIGSDHHVNILGIFALLLSILFIYGCGGGGAGSDSKPEGNNPGVPHTLKLFTDKNVAQTGTYIYLRAKLMDGNGNPIVGAVVNFTNESVIGTLFAAATPATTATTDGNGVATVRIRSTTSGFANVVAENSGLRDMRSIYFTTNDVLSGFPNPVSVVLDVDGDGDSIYNETEDFNLFETVGDDTVIVRATVTVFGQVVSGVGVTFTADNLDASFPGGTDTNEDDIPDQKTSSTNSSGQAYATVKVIPSTITNATVVMNIQAVTDKIWIPEFDAYFTGASMVSLFLEPVVVDLIDLYANPNVVSAGDDSDLSIGVRLNTGAPAPDGTSVQLTATCGSIDTPFVQTTDGNASAKFTAPMTTGTCTVTATAGGVSDSVTITNTAALIVAPTTVTVGDGGSQVFTITNGLPPYSVSAADAPTLITLSTDVVLTDGGTFTVTDVSGDGATDAGHTVTVTDSLGASVGVTFTSPGP